MVHVFQRKEKNASQVPIHRSSLEHHLEFWVSIITTANVLVVLACSLVTVHLCTVQDIEENTKSKVSGVR